MGHCHQHNSFVGLPYLNQCEKRQGSMLFQAKAELTTRRRPYSITGKCLTICSIGRPGNPRNLTFGNSSLQLFGSFYEQWRPFLRHCPQTSGLIGNGVWTLERTPLLVRIAHSSSVTFSLQFLAILQFGDVPARRRVQKLFIRLRPQTCGRYSVNSSNLKPETEG